MGICWLFNLRLGTSRNDGYALALALALSSDEKPAEALERKQQEAQAAVAQLPIRLEEPSTICLIQGMAAKLNGVG